MPRPRLRRVVVGLSLAVAAAVTLGWSPAARWWKAGALLTALSSAHAAGAPTAAAASDLVEEDVADVAPAGAPAPIRARIYRRADQPRGAGRGLVIVHGIHHEGMN